MNIAGKGILLIIVVVAAGVFVLSEGFNDTSGPASQAVESTPEVNQEEQQDDAEQLSEESESSSEQESQGTGDSSGEPSTTSVLHPAAEVRVLVANGTDVTGAAGATLDTLVASEGYNGVQAVNDLSDLILEMTYVYYSQGYELDARKVQMIINADSDYVLPMPAELPIEDLLDANVLVHVGADLFPGG